MFVKFVPLIIMQFESLFPIYFFSFLFFFPGCIWLHNPDRMQPDKSLARETCDKILHSSENKTRITYALLSNSHFSSSNRY